MFFNEVCYLNLRQRNFIVFNVISNIPLAVCSYIYLPTLQGRKDTYIVNTCVFPVFNAVSMKTWETVCTGIAVLEGSINMIPSYVSCTMHAFLSGR